MRDREIENERERDERARELQGLSMCNRKMVIQSEQSFH